MSCEFANMILINDHRILVLDFGVFMLFLESLWCEVDFVFTQRMI